jgi:uncharacterized membrane protein (UPF0127 family)
MPTKDIAKTVSAPSRLRQFLLFFVMLLAVVLVGIGFYFASGGSVTVSRKSVEILNETFKLEVADSDIERTQGLSGRDSIAQNTGMLFDFEKVGDWQIWMKDMHFSIDILWLDEAGKVVFIKNDASPSSYPEVFSAPSPTRYVIELLAGTVEKTGLKIGDVININ